MKVVLMNPAWTDDLHPDRWGVRGGSRWPHFQRRQPDGALPRYIPFPFFLAIAASHLAQQGHKVLLIDAVAADIRSDDLLSRISDFKPDLVFTETSTPSLKADMDLLHRIKMLLPEVRLVGGGTHVPYLAVELVQKEKILDAWVVGEYDLLLADLVDAMAKKQDVSRIAGVIGPTSTDWVFALAPDVNALPPPLFEQLPMPNYSDPVCGLPEPTAQSWLSRGCPFGCTFCVWPQLIYGNRNYRTRSISTALDEVEHLLDVYNGASFYFDDDTANIGEERMLELATEIKARGLDRFPWSMMARADCMTPRMIAALADAGLYSIKYGVESIAPCLIDACSKGTHLERFHAAIRQTREAGVKMHLTFTFGIPGETEETIRETLNFALEAAPETAQFSICTPFPGTVFYEECKRQGWLVSDDWSTYLGSDHAVIDTPWLSATALEAGYKKALASWNDFVAKRLANRQDLLRKEVEHIVNTGGYWTFLGDRNSAAFLFDAQVLNDAFVPFDSSVDFPVVIVSRQEEEKIYRQLAARDSIRAEHSIRLYHMS